MGQEKSNVFNQIIGVFFIITIFQSCVIIMLLPIITNHVITSSRALHAEVMSASARFTQRSSTTDSNWFVTPECSGPADGTVNIFSTVSTTLRKRLSLLKFNRFGMNPLICNDQYRLGHVAHLSTNPTCLRSFYVIIVCLCRKYHDMMKRNMLQYDHRSVVV